MKAASIEILINGATGMIIMIYKCFHPSPNFIHHILIIYKTEEKKSL